MAGHGRPARHLARRLHRPHGGAVGGAAILTGRAVADSWKPAWQVVLACLGLALADRFLIYALFEGELWSPLGLSDRHFLVLIGDRPRLLAVTRVRKMVRQYPWLYERTGLFG